MYLSIMISIMPMIKPIKWQDLTVNALIDLIIGIILIIIDKYIG